MKRIFLTVMSTLLLANGGGVSEAEELCDNTLPSIKVVTHVFPAHIMARIEPKPEDIINIATAIPYPKGIWNHFFGSICNIPEYKTKRFDNFTPRIVVYQQDYVAGQALLIEYPRAKDQKPVRAILGKKQLYINNFLVREMLDRMRIK